MQGDIVKVADMVEGKTYFHKNIKGAFFKNGNVIYFRSFFNNQISVVKPVSNSELIEISDRECSELNNLSVIKKDVGRYLLVNNDNGKILKEFETERDAISHKRYLFIIREKRKAG